MIVIPESFRPFIPLASVRLHCLPLWTRRRFLHRFGSIGGIASNWTTLERAQERLPALQSILDHWGTITLPDGSQAFCCEPYSTVEAASPLVESVATAIGVSWYVCNRSEWFDPFTIRCVLFESLDSIPIDQLPRRKRNGARRQPSVRKPRQR